MRWEYWLGQCCAQTHLQLLKPSPQCGCWDRVFKANFPPILLQRRIYDVHVLWDGGRPPGILWAGSRVLQRQRRLQEELQVCVWPPARLNWLHGKWKVIELPVQSSKVVDRQSHSIHEARSQKVVSNTFGVTLSHVGLWRPWLAVTAQKKMIYRWVNSSESNR